MDIKELELKLSAFIKSTEDNFKSLVDIVTVIDHNVKKLDKRTTDMEIKLELLERKVDLLHNDTSSGFGSVDNKLEDITDKLDQINIVTRFEDEYKNLKHLN